MFVVRNYYDMFINSKICLLTGKVWFMIIVRYVYQLV